MPFILVCGYPSSGKTSYSLQLKQQLECEQKEVILINEENLLLVKNQMYCDSFQEKMMRGQLRSQVDKLIDTLNQKVFRKSFELSSEDIY